MDLDFSLQKENDVLKPEVYGITKFRKTSLEKFCPWL